MKKRIARRRSSVSIHIRPASTKLLYGGIGILVLVAALSRFGVATIDQYLIALLTLFSSLFVLSEINAYNMILDKKLSHDPLKVFGAVVALLAIIAVALTLMQIDFPLLAAIQGLINLLVFLYIVLELFR